MLSGQWIFLCNLDALPDRDIFLAISICCVCVCELGSFLDSGLKRGVRLERIPSALLSPLLPLNARRKSSFKGNDVFSFDPSIRLLIFSQNLLAKCVGRKMGFLNCHFLVFTPWRLFFHWTAFYFVVASEKSNFLIVMDETFDYAKDQMFSNISIGHEPDSHESTQCAL